MTLPAASGGNAPLTYSLSPALPNGLSFNATTRAITGTPTAAQEATTYTYTATDDDGDAMSLAFSITVNEATPGGDQQRDVMPTFGAQRIADQRYTARQSVGTVTLPAAISGNAPLTYSLTPALPAGLSFSAKTRAVTGTPTAALAATEYTYTATDSDRDTVSLTFSITVAADLLPTFGTQTVSDQSYTVGEDMGTVTLPEASGGDVPLTCSLTPALPNGLSFNSGARTITGTPMAAQETTTYTYTATDADDDAAALTFSITVAADLMPTFGTQTVSGQIYTVGRSVGTVRLPAARGGDGKLTYSMSPALPTGLSFNSATRAITGTPTAAWARTQYTYTATDGDGDTVSLTFSITVNEATSGDQQRDLMPTFGSATAPDQTYTVGQDIGKVTLPAARGGNAPLTYSLMPALPPGLTFNAKTHAITGAPTAALAATRFIYRVRDIDGDTRQLTFNITVNEATGAGGGSQQPTQPVGGSSDDDDHDDRPERQYALSRQLAEPRLRGRAAAERLRPHHLPGLLHRR